MTTALLDSPVGPLHATVNDGALVRLVTGDGEVVAGEQRDRAVVGQLQEQLAAYWAGKLQEFDLPLRPSGTSFQQQVWSALRTIPFGQTWSYAELAEAIGQPTAVRAVGAANGRNRVFLVVPCHRVVGSDGRLVGYAGGLDVKRRLLDHERAALWQHSVAVMPE